MDQYSFNIADRTDFRNMEKKNSETFKEYAQPWRVLASQIHPPLSEKEMASFFIDTLKPPYLWFFVGSATTNLADLVTIGERVEQCIKKGLLSEPAPLASYGKKSASAGMGTFMSLPLQAILVLPKGIDYRGRRRPTPPIQVMLHQGMSWPLQYRHTPYPLCNNTRLINSRPLVLPSGNGAEILLNIAVREKAKHGIVRKVHGGSVDLS